LSTGPNKAPSLISSCSAICDPNSIGTPPILISETVYFLFAVPASKKYTVSEIKIGGVPIEFGSQIAEQLEMRLGALFGPVDKDPQGRATSAPTPVPC